MNTNVAALQNYEADSEHKESMFLSSIGTNLPHYTVI